jgi:TatD DNase family protein
MFIDSHAHLEGKRFDSDRDEVLKRAKVAGIAAYLAIGNGDGPDTADCGIRLVEKYGGNPDYPEIWASVGIHPHEASLANGGAYARLEQWARHPRVIAWGEIGLDYFYDHSPRDVQKQVFVCQMEFAQAAKLPIIIHCRPSDNSENAWDDCLALIDKHWKPTGLAGILHCFSGTVEHARRGLDLGFMISFAGNITFPKAQNIRDAAEIVPLDRMLIETDSCARPDGRRGGIPHDEQFSPFLPPEKYGQRPQWLGCSRNDSSDTLLGTGLGERPLHAG